MGSNSPTYSRIYSAKYREAHPELREKMIKYLRKYRRRPDIKKREAERLKKRRLDKLAKGICSQGSCKHPVEPGRTRCKRHLLIERLKVRKRIRDKKEVKP